MKIGDLVKLKFESAYRRYGIVHSVHNSDLKNVDDSVRLVKIYLLGPRSDIAPDKYYGRMHERGKLTSCGYLADELTLVSSA